MVNLSQSGPARPTFPPAESSATPMSVTWCGTRRSPEHIWSTDRLSQNLTSTKLRPLNRAATPTPAGKPAKNSVVPLFSARDDENSNETLQWYADRMAEAQKIVCITLAFNLDEVFQQVISKENDVLRYLVKDDDLGVGESVGHDRDVIFAAGG